MRASIVPAGALLALALALGLAPVAQASPSPAPVAQASPSPAPGAHASPGAAPVAQTSPSATSGAQASPSASPSPAPVAPASPRPTPTPAATSGCANADAGTTINVLHAGSLTKLVRLGLAPAFNAECGVTVTDHSDPAVQLADEVKNGTVTGDVYMSADAHVNKTLMGRRNGDWVRWYLAFARNQQVISYTPQSPFFGDLEKARLGQIPWYQVLMEPGFVLGRTDPNTDPGGYYALFVAELAQRYYGIPDLEDRLLGSDTNPNQLLAPPLYTTTVSGAVPDARFGYLSSAIAGGTPYIALPPQINLSDLDLAHFYAHASFTNTDGVTFRGAPIYDSVTVLQHSANTDAATDFVRLLASPQGHRLVQSDGFLDTPLLVGGDVSAVPPELRPFIAGCYEHCRRDEAG